MAIILYSMLRNSYHMQEGGGEIHPTTVVYVSIAYCEFDKNIIT